MRGFADEVHGTVQYSYDIRTRGGVVNKVGYYNFDKIRDVIGPGEARARLLAEARQSGGRFLIELPGLPQEEYWEKATLHCRSQRIGIVRRALGPNNPATMCSNLFRLSTVAIVLITGLSQGQTVYQWPAVLPLEKTFYRSEERRVGKECRSRWSPYH